MNGKRLLLIATLALGAVTACKNGSSSASASSVPSKIGDTLTFDGSEWTVIEARDAGKTLKSNSEFGEEDKKTEGRFIQVHFKVSNKGSKEEMLLDKPKILDDKGREFSPIDMESFYVPAKAKTLAAFESLPPNVVKECWTVIDVPADAKSLKFQVHGFGVLNEKRAVDLAL